MAHANTNTSLFPSRVVSKCKHPSRYSVCLECAASTAENFIPDSYAIAIFAGTLTNNRKNLWAQWARLGTVGTIVNSGHEWAQWARLHTVGTNGHSGHDWAQWAQLVTFPRCQFRYEICLVDFCVRIPFPTPATCSSRAGNHFSRNVLHRSRHVWQYNF